MQMISPQERAAMDARLEQLYKSKLDVQDRINKAAALGDLKENSEYHTAKDENRAIAQEVAELEYKIRNSSVVNNDDVPEDTVFLGHTVRLLDLDDDSETLVKIVGEVQPPGNDDVMPVSVTSPMGDALMKAKIGETIKVRAPRGTMEFKILEIIR